MTPDAARRLHVHVGSVIPFAFYTAAQEARPGFGTARVAPYLMVATRVVGIVATDTTLVRDDIDRVSWTIFSPALTSRLLTPPLASTLGWTNYGVQLRRGDAGVAQFEREVSSHVAKGTTLLFHDVATVEAQAQHADAPEVIALWMFALIAALALALIATQAISRLLQEGADDRDVLRALGAGPPMIVWDAVVAPVGALVLGTALALGVAIGLSPLSPLGTVRAVYPSRGVAVDGVVLGVGSLAIVLGLSGVSAVLASRSRAAPQRGRVVASPAARAVAAVGLGPAASEGVRLALARGRGRSAVPVRSVVVGATLAVVILVATLTFASSLTSLVARPALYGWNYSYLLNSTFGVGDTPAPIQRMLARDRLVAAWTPVVFLEIEFDGRTIPTMFEPSAATVAPPQLSGHPVRALDQVVLGPASLAALHKRVGDTVVGSYTAGQSMTLRIVGTATFPAIGLHTSLHPSLGVGAVASSSILGAGLDDGPVCGTSTQSILVRLRPHVAPAAGLADGRRVAAAAGRIFASAPASSPCARDGFVPLGVQRPAEIVNYRSMGALPALLGAVLALAALAALAATLVASVRRRRRDMAVFKALGFTKRQLQAAVAWQATVTMGLGVVVGVPVGIAMGRWLWTLFARAIYVVPQPTVPWGPIGLVVLGAMIFANVVAAVPGRLAATTPTALVLRAE